MIRLGLEYNPFVRRQTPDSRHGHTTLSEQEVLLLVGKNWEKRKPGYRQGVVLVPVPPAGFFSGTVTLKPGMPLRATYEPRVPGEEPRLHVGIEPPPEGYEAAKQPAVAVDIVLYSSIVLAEDGDNKLPPQHHNWEVVSINPRMCEEEEPMSPDTLMANHFHESGGTATLMTDSEFVEALRKSRAYWKDKVTLG